MTLVEVVLAVLLFAVGSVAALELLHRSQIAETDGDSALAAVYLAQRRLEELRNSAYASLANEAKAVVSSPSGFSQFSRQVAVTALTSTAPYNSSHLTQVAVTVYWTAPGGETNVTLQTLRASD